MTGADSKRTTRSARLLKLVAMLGVLTVAGWAAWGALAASAPPTPTLSASPVASPTNSPTETLTFSSTGATSYQCSLNGAVFTGCTSPKTYGSVGTPLATGSYSFQVKALDKNGRASGSASYGWVVDRTLPTVSSIVRADANPTKASALRWTVTFSEPVKNVAGTNFGLVTSGLGGTAPTVTSAAPSGSPPTATWTVTASTSGTTGLNSGSIQLNLTSKGTIQDALGNSLGGSVPVPGPAYTFDTTAPAAAPTISAGPAGLVNSASATFAFSGETGASFQCALDSTTSPAACSNPTSYSGLAQGSHTFYVRQLDAAGNVGTLFASRSWTVDTVPPPAPVIGTKPDDPNGDGIAKFDWTDSESPVAYRCSLENKPSFSCTSPFRTIVDVSNDGQHQFAVSAVDAAGNESTASYTWKVLKGVNVVADGDAVGLLYPGGPTRTIALTLHNPNNFPVTIDTITVTVSASSSPPGCSAAANIEIQQSNVGNGPSPQTVTVPANSNLTLPSGTASRPTIRLVDTGLDQQACKNGSFGLTYLATGSK
jgi:hypothetical protein